MNIAGLWDQLVDVVCRPPRDDSYTEADLVGGQRASFRLYDRRYYRLDVTLENIRGQKLQCSHYRPCVVTSSDGRLPCVIYCHCNSGSRRDAEEILFHMLPKGITVFAFDFAGSGLSDGDYVTLGAMEVDDLAAVVKYLRDEGSTSTIGLWGRSMGSVTALMYSQQDPSIAGMVLDSSFSRLVDLMMELGTEQRSIPKPLLKVALAMLKRSVKKRAGFSVDKVAPLDCVGGSFIPALFGHASDDTFVQKHHSERLYQAYSGDKNFVSFEGDHNSVRPDFFYDSALIFLVQVLRVEELVGPSIDLQALPEEALPHLRMQRTSTYVTASRSLTGAELDAALADEEGSDGSSHGSSPTSASRVSPRLSHLSRTGMSRSLRPPWALDQLRGRPAARRSPEQLAASLDALRLGQGPGTGGEGEFAATEQLEGGGSGVPDRELGGFILTEEEALQMALAASLQDVSHQTQQQQQAQEPGQQQGPLGAGHAALSATAAGAQAQQDAQQGQQRKQTSGDVPLSEDEENAMLEAAIAASLAAPQPDKAPADAEAGDGLQPSGAPPVKDTEHGSSEAELRYCFGAAKQGTEAGIAREADAASGPEQRQAASGVEEPEAIPEACSAGAAAQANADEHAGNEAAVVRVPALQVRHALDDAVAAATAAGSAGAADVVVGGG